MELLSSDARNTTALAIYAGVPSLPSGTWWKAPFKRCWPASAEASRSFSPGVSVTPGLTAFTRMRRPFKSVVQGSKDDLAGFCVGQAKRVPRMTNE
jgi:hypothetical protein